MHEQLLIDKRLKPSLRKIAFQKIDIFHIAGTT